MLKGNFKICEHTIEDLVCKSKDGLKNYALMPIYIEGVEKPYATLKLIKQGQNWQLCNIGSMFDELEQLEIYRSLPGFENAKIEKKASHLDCVQIKPKYVINEFCQSQTEENLFFAGSILGINGYEKCIASGHFVAREVFRYLNNFDLIKFPQYSLINDVNNKILCKKSLKLNENIKEYDIMDSRQVTKLNDLVEKLFEKTSNGLARFKEEYFYGKHF